MSAPRDLDDIAADRRYAPSVRRAVEDMQKRLTDPLLRPFETESEVMHPGAEDRPNNGGLCLSKSPDTRPPSATEANHLDQIATLVRLLTYGEMMDLAAALWKMRPEGKEITEQELPGMLHRWSAQHG